MGEAAEPARRREITGGPVTTPVPLARPERTVHQGGAVRLEPLDADQHAAELYAASHGDPETERLWRYLPSGPYATLDAFRDWLAGCAASDDPLFFAIRDTRTGKAAGMASYLNIAPAHGSIEIGHIWLGPVLQNSRGATEALYLMLCHALDELGYRRMEWKCDALNAASRSAATRLGFSFEGIFYQHRVVKGLNRDTAWFSILDSEWPDIRAGFETWLAPENFDEAGRQRRSLRALNWPAGSEGEGEGKG